MGETCPEDQQLFDFLLGKKTPDWIGRHIGNCGDCQQTLLQFDQTNDSLVVKLQTIFGKYSLLLPGNSTEAQEPDTGEEEN